jgi:hypothetical protein
MAMPLALTAAQVDVVNQPDEGLDLIALYRRNVHNVLHTLRDLPPADVVGVQSDGRRRPVPQPSIITPPERLHSA